MPRRAKPRPTRQPVKGGLRALADAKKSGVQLLRDVQTHVVAQGVKNAGVGREAHKIHVSELVKDTCPRHLYYKLVRAERTDATAPAYHRLEMIWAAGHQEHAKWQRWLQEMGDLWGSWKCLVCENIFVDTSPEKCPNCFSELLEYKEVNLEDPEYPIVGHADGAVPRLKAFVEVKSFSVGTVRIEAPQLVKDNTVKVEGKSMIDHDGLWNAVKRPLRSHLIQGMMYLWMASRMGGEFAQYNRMIYIYENKTTQATKTFEVDFSKRFLRPYFEILDEVMAAVEEGVAPPRPELFDKGSKPCKDCIFRTGCWNQENNDDRPQSAPVSTRRSRSRSEEVGGETEVRSPRSSVVPDPGGSGGHHRPRRRRTRRADGEVHEVGRAPGDTTGSSRGGREVGRAGTGQGEGPRFPRKRQGRN